MTTNVLLDTIVSDLKDGVSWLEDDVVNVGLEVWNTVKGAFIALEPKLAGDVMTILKSAVAQAESGHTIEEIESAALNLATGDVLGALTTAGSGVLQVLIAGLKAIKV